MTTVYMFWAQQICEDGKCRLVRNTDSSLPTRLQSVICQNTVILIKRVFQ